MVVKTSTLFLSFILSAIVLKAQFSDSVHHYVNFLSSGIINKTNDGSSYVLTNAFKYSINKKSIVLNFSNNWIYGEQKQQLTNNDFSSTLDFNLYKTFPHFYYWGLGSYDKSYSLKINHRIQSGLGVAYNILDKPDTYLNVSDGILYESSSLKINDSTNLSNQILRNSFRVKYRFAFNELVIIDGMHFFQNSLESQNDYIIKSVSSLTLKLRKWLGITTAATYNRTQQTRRENLLLNFGLTAEKYF